MKPKQIDQLKRARSGLRGWMTRDLDAVREIIESDSPDVTRVEEKLESITTRLHKAEDLQMEIEKLLSDDSDVREEVDAQGPWFDMVTDRIHVLKLWLKEKQKQNTSEKPEKFEPIMPEPKPTSCTPKMKLPKTDLRKFSGEVLDWPEFWDIFRVSIHDNPEIPAVQKFVYLKSLLTDEAAGYVANIKTEEANYEVAVERLKSRYGKDEVQRNRLMSKLADMKSLDQSNKAMRDAVDELCATVRALEVQGVTTEQYGALLMPLIESKLPRDWRLEWAREKAGLAKEEVGLSKMLKFLERELDIRESADPSVEKELSFKHHPSVEKEKPVLPTASGLMAKPVTCTFCKGPHTTKQCTVPMSVEDRFKKLREVRACFRCARSGHRMSACRFRKPCPCGRGSHIPQLCKTGGVKVQDAQRQPTVTPPSNTPSHPSWNPATPPYVPSTGTQNQVPPLSRPPQEAMMSSARNADFKTTGVMMRTVCVVIGNVVVRALCDTGATFTMMSSQLAASVPKRVVGKRHLRIETLGDVLEGEFDVVEVTARGENIASTFTFQAVVMDELSGVFERVEPECYQALQEVVGGCPILADLAGPGADDIGIVFGEDCYDTIVTGMTWKLRKKKLRKPGTTDSQVQQIHKVLGVSWDLNSDELLPLVDVEDIVPKKLTKREVLSCLSKIYDPCGLVSPVVTPLKIIVQDCWKEKLGWDEEVSVDLRRRVEEVLKGFSGGNQLRVNRWLGITPSQYKDTRVSLHVFTDASSRAYAAAAYLRVADVKGNITVNLVASKCRLAPPDGDTIPRLELLGALMGARLLNSLRIEYSEVLKIDDEFLWTDSSVALAWISQGPRVGGVFVANRVEEITAVGGVWSWVPTNENPADLPTRGMTVTQLSGSKIWWNGPEWLKRPETEWPKHSKNETGKAFLIMAVTDNEEPMYVEDIVDTPRTSKYLRTLRSVAWMLRWHKSTGNSQAMLSLEELNCAKTVILKQVQRKFFSSVLRKCRKCSRFLAAPASEQTPPLPRCRVTCKLPFETTGMDLGGPLYLKDNSKVWFVVFTCMSVRAIHLELVTSLSTEALIQALQRFMNRRGVPQLCISDHGSNFVAAAKWVREKNLDMKWQFVVERGPWWGGAWERLVGIVKGLLRRSLGHAVLTWEELVTALTEVEKVINCRPISYLWESANPDGGVPIPLCPEQFLLPPRGDFKEEERELNLSDEFRQRKMWLSSMNDLWRKEYLHQVLGSQGEVWKTRPNPLKVGEVVLVADDREKRLNWKMGVVRQLIIGRDGRCRAAIVQVKSGMLTRPVRKLYKLEICAESHNLPPITRLPEDVDKDDEILDAEAEMTDGGEEAEHEVSMPQRTRSGREIVCPSRFRD